MPGGRSRQLPSRPPELRLWQLYPVFFVAVFLSHWSLLRLPYFWDEAGYYIPAAWDLFRTGSLIPQTTLTNAHPPLPSLLLAAWWRISGFAPIGTRTLVSFVSAAALLGVYRLARAQAGTLAAIAVTILTGAYPVWFVQSTLAHADIFAAACTLWALSFYLPDGRRASAGGSHAMADPASDARVPVDERRSASGERRLNAESGSLGNRRSGPETADEPNTASQATARTWTAILFALAALSKETAILTPLALAVWEAVRLFKPQSGDISNRSRDRSERLLWLSALLFPLLPLALWYAYHRLQTGFFFGNPEFLRYNATANLSFSRIVLALWHRLVHLGFHMNMYVPLLLTAAVLRMPTRFRSKRSLRPSQIAIVIVIITNWLAFSVLGGALLTRYLLALYPLILLLCVMEWRRRVRRWYLLGGIALAAFLAALFINPPYTIAPEDNLSYRNMIVLHQHAIAVLAKHFPEATVLTAWPATAELERPELGYVTRPMHTVQIEDFTGPEIEKASANPGAYDTALVFSTKCAPAGGLDLGRIEEASATRLFGFHHDLHPVTIAALLHGEIVWQQTQGCEWAAVLHFPRTVEARLLPSTVRAKVK